ncbi:AI-2E family transporter [Endozoicomonas sp. ONNA2]|uniref:AI-2E family transporter n=1 Tax=Endozoicomonas sp. ONNA2 TaxID=2828741 RepID=UPI0021479CA3|nr:AI-2E family transporter [Endozoicomonas sp. ONNA2]
MLTVIKEWLHNYLSDQEAIVLLIILLVGFVVVLTMGKMLAPALAALIFAFLMHGLVSWLERRRMPHLFAVNLVFTGFVAALLLVIFVVVPLVWEQVTHLLNAMPGMVREGQALLVSLPELYPGFVSEHQVSLLVTTINKHLADFGQWALSFSLSRLPGVVALLVYLILVPILVFFFLKDKEVLLGWMVSILPRRRRLIDQVADEMNDQIANYIRGKAIEIVIVGGVSYVLFALSGLSYSALLAVMVGFSVVVPYIGATVVTIPVAVIGFFQWGMGDQFVILMVGYGIIQALDGNVLVPLLFSEAVNLHPVAIIIAVLVFGGLWGFWGIFFAIPLATLFKAVMNAWPAVADVESS